MGDTSAAPRQSIYGAYGIRGIWGRDLDETVGAKLAKAYVTRMKPKRVAVGRDGRLSGPALCDALISGFRDMGVNVVDVGVLPVDAFYFAVAAYGLDGGAMATASHNPSEWNGVKFVDRKAQLLIGGQNRELGSIVERGVFAPISKHKGHYEEVDPIPDFVAYIVSNVGVAGMKPMKVVVDPGNGPVARIIPALMKRMPCEWTGINMEVDGRYPGRGPDPKKSNALVTLGNVVRERGADVGVAFDADGDRMFLVDERGSALAGETTGLILARAFLDAHPGGSVVYNVVCSRAVPEFVQSWGGMPVRAGVGSVNMKPALVRSNGLLGIETSGHYLIPKLNYLDSGLVPMAYALKEIAGLGTPLSEIAAPLTKYAHEFIDLPCDEVEAAKRRVRDAFRQNILDELDGITVEFPEWWCNVRESNTEPLLRLTIEANDRKSLQQHREHVLSIVRG